MKASCLHLPNNELLHISWYIKCWPASGKSCCFGSETEPIVSKGAFLYFPSRKMLHLNSLVQAQKSKAERSSNIHHTIFPPKIPFSFPYRQEGFKTSLAISFVNSRFETGLQSMFASLWFMKSWSCRPTPLREMVGCMKKLLTQHCAMPMEHRYLI